MTINPFYSKKKKFKTLISSINDFDKNVLEIGIRYDHTALKILETAVESEITRKWIFEWLIKTEQSIRIRLYTFG